MTRKATSTNKPKPSGCDRIWPPQQYPEVMWRGLRQCQEVVGEWHPIWRADTEADAKDFMRRAHAFRKSFAEFPKEFPDLTDYFVRRRYRMKFQRNVDDGLEVQMMIRRAAGVWIFAEI
jgi:hypothetical protein